MKSTLENLTIIIPSYNRPSYLLRNMKYWSGRGPKVVVLDGSEEAIAEEIIKELDTNIVYIHKKKPINERLLLAVDLIDTPYAMLCGDDEFMLQSGVSACMNFLENNLDYSVCCGRSIGFTPYRNFLKLFPAKSGHASHFVNQDNPIDRIKYHIENYHVTTIYGVHRKGSFVFCLTNSSLFGYSCAYVSEHLFEILASAYGKSKILPIVSWLRSYENPSISNALWNRKYLLGDWYSDPSKSEEVHKFHQTAIDSLVSIGVMDVNGLIESVVVESTKSRINKELIRCKLKKEKTFNQQLRDYLINNLTYTYKLLRHGFRLSYRLIIYICYRRAIDLGVNYFISKKYYSFTNMLKTGINIPEQTEKELVEVFNLIVNKANKWDV